MTLGPDAPLDESSASPVRRDSFSGPTNSELMYNAIDMVIRRLQKIKCSSWEDFFNREKLNQPQRDIVQKRIASNLLQYQANYCIIGLVGLLLVCVAQPKFLFAFLLTLVCGFYFFLMFPHNRVVILQHAIPFHIQLKAFASFFGLLMLYTGGSSLFVVAILTLGVIGAHACLHVEHARKGRSTETLTEVLNHKDFLHSVLLGLDEPVFDEENPQAEDKEDLVKHNPGPCGSPYRRNKFTS